MDFPEINYKQEDRQEERVRNISGFFRSQTSLSWATREAAYLVRNSYIYSDHALRHWVSVYL